MKECALCYKKSELKKSHIIPRFVTDWIKKTGPTGFLRGTETDFRRRVQDRFKEELLCVDCEGLFSKSEKIFAEKVFRPYLNGYKSEFEYEEWIRYFITSVNWRILYIELMSYLNKTREISNKNISLVTNVIMGLREYLLGRGEFPKGVETHLYFIDDLAFINHADLYPICFFKRSIFGSLLENDEPEYCYIYSNLCGILIVTAIKKTSMDIWQNTLIIEVGIITTKQLMGSPVLGKLSMILKDASKGKIPKEQARNILEVMKENEKKVLKSKFIEEFSKDIELNELWKIYRKE
ncbi:hypothetical protein EV204_11325 [Tissierella praeacuta]|uniref:hypothetical protein n=1 Tax=Tissierella praeacuta TaxID=43131 RepID=UPI001049BAC3|nr:hypothetical protein [Tissierella praeacuta]TCU66915.1 hypothetical protein EV204_11325 [Tissierella praeacuta]